MKEIDERILQYCGIYQKPNVDEKKKKRILRQKQEIEKITGMKIEKIYLFGENYWGKNSKGDKFDDVCFLVDERIQQLDATFHLLDEYVMKKNECNITLWSLGQFEKRSQSTRESDYYIARFGALIYDSGKNSEIDERLYTTQYASTMHNYQYTKRYTHSDRDGILMRGLIKVYLSKIGYYVENTSLLELIEYLEYVNEDETIKSIIQQYKGTNEVEQKNKICQEFERYIKKEIKEKIVHYKLIEEPTMLIYEKLYKKFEETGTLDINDLTKEELYTMYIIQKKNIDEIAKLYNVTNDKISNKRNYWNILFREVSINSSNMQEMLKELSEWETKQHLYLSLKKSGLLSFEKCIMPILAFMKTTESTYLLKEFWKFTEFEKEDIEVSVTNIEKGTWYRANLCMDFLKENDFVEEIDFKKYRLTLKGQALLLAAKDFELEEIDLKFIINQYEKAKLFRINLWYRRLYGKWTQRCFKAAS